MTAPDFAARVIAWQRDHGRSDLPWQTNTDPYRVWLSEVMLQQTQVATVLPYYARFLTRFADVRALADAPLDDVLAAWSGLGYYSRARNLHRCARVVVAEHGGEFPRSAAELAELPGIGRSTAAAVAAFCFGERCAILDGNVKRVLARHLGFEADLSSASEVATLWRKAEALLPEREVGAYTQGLMDLGATLCTRASPACERCPMARDCVAFAQGRPGAFPVKTRRLKRGQRANAWLWLSRADDVWLTQRPDKGVWAGLWSLPEFETLAQVQTLTEDWPGRGQSLPDIAHALTHFDWLLKPWRHALPATTPTPAVQAWTLACPQGRWVAREDALTMGLPAPLRVLLTRYV